MTDFSAWRRRSAPPMNQSRRPSVPSPRPPADARPGEISITEVQTLIRDPYAVYARRILRLSPLNPLRPMPDARTRGTVIHDIMKDFFEPPDMGDPAAAREEFLRVADGILEEKVAWPAARRLWRVRLAQLVDWLIDDEAARRERGAPVALERKSCMSLPGIGIELHGKIDRIDLESSGALAIYDYKTSFAANRGSADSLRQAAAPVGLAGGARRS